MKHIIGIAEMKVSTTPRDFLITYSLGSCIGVTIFDPEAGVGGMVHCLLPLSRMDPAKANAKPCMFTDTGVSLLLRTMLKLGARKDRLIAKVAGGSNIMDKDGTFNIGERNYTVVRKILWKNDILITAEDVGGSISRTLALYMEDGRTTLQTDGVEKEMVARRESRSHELS